MAAPLLDDHRDYLIQEHRAGRTAGDLAHEFGVTHKVITRVLGNEYRGRIWKGDPKEIAAAYLAGESELSISLRLGIHRPSVVCALKRAGVQRRSMREAQLIRWVDSTPEQRAAQTAASHIAATGRKKTFEEKCLTAQARYRNPLPHISPYEITLGKMLTERGIKTVPQWPIGPYNCDLAACPVAVEVWGGEWHWGGRHLARTSERFRYLLDTGWHILAINVTVGHPLTPAVADYITTFIQKARRKPPTVREYRVIWGAGEFSTGGSAEDDNITVVKPFTSRRNPATGQYETISK